MLSHIIKIFGSYFNAHAIACIDHDDETVYVRLAEHDTAVEFYYDDEDQMTADIEHAVAEWRKVIDAEPPVIR